MVIFNKQYLFLDDNIKKYFMYMICPFLGKIVMTDYNKRTYRVDDVAWRVTPKSTFKMRDGDVTYMDYYYKVCKKII